MRGGAAYRGIVADNTTAQAASSRQQRGLPRRPVAMRSARRRSPGQARLGGFCDQLAGLLDAGLPLASALELIARTDESPAVAELADGLSRRLIAGRSFGDALDDVPDIIPPVVSRILAVGDLSGRLAPALRQVSAAQLRGAERVARLRAALAYPLGVLVMAGLVTVGMLVWIVPGFAELFSSLGDALPAPTRLALAASQFCIEWGGWAFGATLAVAAAAAALTRYSRACRSAVRRIVRRLPLVGAVLRELALANWAATLGGLLATRVPLLEAASLLQDLTGDPRLDTFSATLPARLRSGATLERSLAGCQAFPPRLIALVSIACHSATLDVVLLEFAERVEQRMRRRLDTLLRLAEPILMALLGLVVGGIVFALYLPIVQAGQMM